MGHHWNIMDSSNIEHGGTSKKCLVVHKFEGSTSLFVCHVSYCQMTAR